VAAAAVAAGTVRAMAPLEVPRADRTFPSAEDVPEVPEVSSRFPAKSVIIDTARTQRWLRRRGLQSQKLPKGLERPVLALYDALDVQGNGLIELRLLYVTLLVLHEDMLSGELQQGGDTRHTISELTADVEQLMGIVRHLQRAAFVRLLQPLAARHPDFLEVLPFREAAQTAIRRGELRRVFLGDIEAGNTSAASEPDSPLSPFSPITPWRRSRANTWQRERESRRGDTTCAQPSSVVKSGSSPSFPVVQQKSKSVTVGENTLKAELEGCHGKVKPLQIRRQRSMPALGGWTPQIKNKKAMVPIQVPSASRRSWEGERFVAWA